MAGLSLIELMVAVALGLLILAGLVTIFANTSAARSEVERTSRQIENGRYAVEVLSDDLRLAGFYGGLDLVNSNPGIAAPGSLTDPCLVPATTDEWMQPLHFHVQGYAAPNITTIPDITGTTCNLPSLKPGSDVLVVRRVQTCARPDPVTGLPAPPEGCRVPPVPVDGLPYIQVALCSDDLAADGYRLGPNDGVTAFNRRQKNCASDLAILRRYFVNIYFVSTTNGVNGTGDPVPTLKRLEFTGAGWTETALVEGVEQLNIEYGVDNDNDGLPDLYTRDPGTVAAWTNVMIARFYALARNIDRSPGFADTKTYSLGSVTITSSNYDPGYRRHVYATLVRIVNPAGKKETP